MTRGAEPRNWLGVVLAGGRSRRMGRDKAMLRIGDGTLLDRGRALLSASGCRRVLVSGRPTDQGGLPDSHPGEGPAHAILDAIEYALGNGFEGVLIIPVDMPALTTSELRPLMNRVAAHGCAWEGIVLPIALSAAAPIPRRNSIWSVRRLLDGWDVVRLPAAFDQAPRFANLNTPEDVRRFDDGA